MKSNKRFSFKRDILDIEEYDSRRLQLLKKRDAFYQLASIESVSAGSITTFCAGAYYAGMETHYSAPTVLGLTIASVGSIALASLSIPSYRRNKQELRQLKRQEESYRATAEHVEGLVDLEEYRSWYEDGQAAQEEFFAEHASANGELSFGPQEKIFTFPRPRVLQYLTQQGRS